MMISVTTRLAIGFLVLGSAAQRCEATPPQKPECSWVVHPGKHLGGQEKEYPKYLSVEQAQKICIEILGVKCKGVTCADERGYSCAPRKGEPYLTESASKEEVSWAKHCTGLEKGQQVMSYFESAGGKSFYMEAAEVVKPKEYHVTLKFLSDGATQVVPSGWVDVDAPILRNGYSSTYIPEELQSLIAVIRSRPLLCLLVVGVLALQFLVDLARGRRCFGAVHFLPPLFVVSYSVMTGAVEAKELVLLYILSVMILNAVEVVFNQIGVGNQTMQPIKNVGTAQGKHTDYYAALEKETKAPLTSAKSGSALLW